MSYHYNQGNSGIFDSDGWISLQTLQESTNLKELNVKSEDILIVAQHMEAVEVLNNKVNNCFIK